MATRLAGVRQVPAKLQHGAIDPRPAEIIVVHSMECPCDDRHVNNWASSLQVGAGSAFFAHFYCGPTTTVQVAELGRVVAHVGNGNVVRGRWTLGIEQAGYAAFSRQQWLDCGVLNQSSPLIARLIAEGHGAKRWLTDADLRVPGIRGVTSHASMARVFGGSTHTDPGPNWPHDVVLGAPVYRPETAPADLHLPTQEEDDMHVMFIREKSHAEVYVVGGDGSRTHVQRLPDQVTVLTALGSTIVAPPAGAKVDTIDGVAVWVVSDGVLTG